MAVDMFITIDDIKGESADANFKDAIDVLSWTWGMTQSGSAHLGTGTGTGKVSVRDISLTKYVDRSSPVLMKYCCKGKYFGAAKLTIRKAGDAALPYVVISMTEGLISSVTHGGTGHDERMVESVTLNFKAFKFEYQPQKNGKPDGGTVPHNWNIAKNAES
jgi:type VI secretion system secreted protein Hcp